MAGILLPNGNPTHGGMYAVTFRMEGYHVDSLRTQPNIFVKHIGIITELPKLGPEEINALTQSAVQLLQSDPDFVAHRNSTEEGNYKRSVSMVWLQKLDS